MNQNGDEFLFTYSFTALLVTKQNRLANKIVLAVSLKFRDG